MSIGGKQQFTNQRGLRARYDQQSAEIGSSLSVTESPQKSNQGCSLLASVNEKNEKTQSSGKRNAESILSLRDMLSKVKEAAASQRDINKPDQKANELNKAGSANVGGYSSVVQSGGGNMFQFQSQSQLSVFLKEQKDQKD